MTVPTILAMMRRFVPEAEAPDRGLYNPRDAEKQARIMRQFDTSVRWSTSPLLPLENHRTIPVLDDIIGYMWYRVFGIDELSLDVANGACSLEAFLHSELQ